MLVSPSSALGLLSSATQLSHHLWTFLSFSSLSSEAGLALESAPNCRYRCVQGLAGNLWLQQDHQWLQYKWKMYNKYINISHKLFPPWWNYTYLVRLGIPLLGNLQQLDVQHLHVYVSKKHDHMSLVFKNWGGSVLYSMWKQSTTLAILLFLCHVTLIVLHLLL